MRLNVVVLERPSGPRTRKRDGYISYSRHMFLVLRSLRHAQTLLRTAHDGAAETWIIAVIGAVLLAIDPAKDLLDLVKPRRVVCMAQLLSHDMPLAPQHH